MRVRTIWASWRTYSRLAVTSPQGHPHRLLAFFAILVAANGISVWLTPDRAAAATCAASSGLYAKTGVGEIRTKRLSCDSARRILRRWGTAKGNIRRVSPAGWRCRIKVDAGPGGGVDYMCRRGAKRMEFLTGG